MKAMLIAADGSLAWSEVPDPQPQAGEVLIEVWAAALNRADRMQRAGSYPSPAGWPQWMGLEVAGRIISAPPASRWKAGDRVCALLGGGGYAEQVAVPEGLVLPIPEGLSMEAAAAIPEAFATAYLNLCIEGGMRQGDTVFIAAGASGLGMIAIQLAKSLGATVVTTVGSQDKAAFVRRLGADVVINRKEENVAEQLAKHPVDIAMDCVSGAQLGACLQTMAPGGRWIIIAALGGSASELDMVDFFKRGLHLIGSTLRSRSSAMKAEILAALEQRVWPALADGRIQVLLHQVLPMAEAEEAHRILGANENLGKVVLQLRS